MRRLAIALLILLTGMARWSLAAPPGLTLYSSLGYAAPVARAFTRATGIPVRVVTASGAAILAHITRQGGHPRWSLAWINDATSAVALDRAGLLAHDLPAPPELTEAGTRLAAPDGAWVPTGLTLAAVLVAAADPYVALPSRWDALTGPAYHGIIGMADPQLSRRAYPALAGLLRANGGWPEAKSFVTSLKKGGLHIYASDADTLAALRSGSIALGIMNSSIAIDYAESRDKSLRLAFPKPAYAVPSVIMMAKALAPGARAAALRFIAFANRPGIQALRMREGGSDGWYWPVTRHPAPHPGLPALASLDPHRLNAQEWGSLQPAVIAWFNQSIVGPGT